MSSADRIFKGSDIFDKFRSRCMVCRQRHMASSLFFFNLCLFLAHGAVAVIKYDISCLVSLIVFDYLLLKGELPRFNSARSCVIRLSSQFQLVVFDAIDRSSS